MPSVEFSMGTTPYWNLPFSTSAEDLLDGGHGAVAGGPAEFFQGRQVGKGGLRSQEGHAQGDLDLPGGRDDLPEDVAQGRVAQGAGVEVHEMGQDLFFPLEVQGAPALLVLDAGRWSGPGSGGGSAGLSSSWSRASICLPDGLLFRSWLISQRWFPGFCGRSGGPVSSRATRTSSPGLRRDDGDRLATRAG